MEIIDRKKRPTDGEIVSWNENPKCIQEEVLRRASKAGYCTRNGEPVSATKIMTSVNFGKQKLNVWPRDENGNLIE